MMMMLMGIGMSGVNEVETGSIENLDYLRKVNIKNFYRYYSKFSPPF